jgi:hypothetical protein
MEPEGSDRFTTTVQGSYSESDGSSPDIQSHPRIWSYRIYQVNTRVRPKYPGLTL